MQFSRRTLIAAVEIMETTKWTHQSLTRRLLKWDRELNAQCAGGTLGDRFNHLINFLDEQPLYRLEDGSLLGEAIVEEAITLLPDEDDPWEPLASTKAVAAAFLRVLGLDGFDVSDGVLRRAFPSDLGLPEAEDDVTRLLDKHSFRTAKDHLRQALDAHGRGDWAAANSQLRPFFECLLDDIAIKLDKTAAELPSSENRRARLAKIGFLHESLKEWSGDGKNFINGVWQRLHPAGSHPGLSDEEDSTFRRHVVLLTARLLLVRFDKRGNS